MKSKIIIAGCVLIILVLSLIVYILWDYIGKKDKLKPYSQSILYTTEERPEILKVNGPGGARFAWDAPDNETRPIFYRLKVELYKCGGTTEHIAETPDTEYEPDWCFDYGNGFAQAWAQTVLVEYPDNGTSDWTDPILFQITGCPDP